MSLTYNKKVPVFFTREEECMLDGQSKICNWLYNQLLAACQKDDKENNNELKLLEGRNLRNYGVSLKGKHLFLNTVFSSVLKDPAERLLKAFTSFVFYIDCHQNHALLQVLSGEKENATVR